MLSERDECCNTGGSRKTSIVADYCSRLNRLKRLSWDNNSWYFKTAVIRIFDEAAQGSGLTVSDWPSRRRQGVCRRSQDVR